VLSARTARARRAERDLGERDRKPAADVNRLGASSRFGFTPSLSATFYSDLLPLLRGACPSGRGGDDCVEMQGLSEGARPRPLFVGVLEAAAAAAGWDRGHHVVTLELEDGHLRRWGHDDPRNSPYELGSFDTALTEELERLADTRLGCSSPPARWATPLEGIV
jgi:hypothetical protein